MPDHPSLNLVFVAIIGGYFISKIIAGLITLGLQKIFSKNDQSEKIQQFVRVMFWSLWGSAIVYAYRVLFDTNMQTYLIERPKGEMVYLTALISVGVGLFGFYFSRIVRVIVSSFCQFIGLERHKAKTIGVDEKKSISGVMGNIALVIVVLYFAYVVFKIWFP